MQEKFFRPLKFVNLLFNFPLSDTRGSNETGRVNFGGSFSVKTLLEESSRVRARLIRETIIKKKKQAYREESPSLQENSFVEKDKEISARDAEF